MSALKALYLRARSKAHLSYPMVTNARGYLGGVNLKSMMEACLATAWHTLEQ